MRDEQGAHGQKRNAQTHTIHARIQEGAALCRLRQGEGYKSQNGGDDFKAFISRSSPARAEIYLHNPLQRMRSKWKPKNNDRVKAAEIQ